MNKKSQLGEKDTAELTRVHESEVQTVVDPATISALVSAGALVLDFVGHLVGGKTGAALSGLSAQINGLNNAADDDRRQGAGDHHEGGGRDHRGRFTVAGDGFTRP
jgi:hypothetical protein